MKVRLLSFRLSGVKSLQKEIELKFSNYLLKDPSKNICRIKSIYGVNGAGKTSIVLGMKILSELLRNPDYLSEKRVVLKDLINFSTGTFSATVCFSAFDDNEKMLDIFRYSTAFSYADDSFFIQQESLDLIPGNNLKGKAKNMFLISNGQIQSIKSSDSSYVDKLKGNYNNLLLKSSLLSLHPSLESEQLNEAIDSNRTKFLFSYSILALFRFSRSVMTFTDRDNIPLNPNLHLALLKDYIQEQSSHPDRRNSINENRILVSRKDYPSFVRMTSRLEKFIQLFKPELKKIRLDSTDAGNDVLTVTRVFDYGGKNQVNEYLESSGIKRINQMFQFLDFSIQGGIVFIDELDNSISGVYLLKLLQYISRFSQGQLCFTCHNTFLMQALQNQRFSIDFVSSDGRIKSWAKSGHYLPEEQYTRGYIPGFAFNTIDLDFYDVFSVDEEAMKHDKK